MSPGEARAVDTAGSGGLRRNVVGAGGLVLVVVACASPLAALIGNVPLGFVLGNGAGMPGAILLSGLLLLCFAVGFVAMSPHVQNAAAFYAYVRAGLGSRPGNAAALMATLGYNALAAGLVGFMGYFGKSVFASELGLGGPWEVYALGAMALSTLLTVVGIDAGIRLLMVLLLAEGLLIAASTVVTLFSHASGISASSFSPDAIFSGAPGVALMFALISFIGFEATAVFAEEARDSHRTIRRATIVAVITITVIYTLASVAIVAYYGAGDVKAADPGTMYPAMVVDALGPWSEHAINILFLTSLFATLLAVQNMATRYMFGLAREGLFPAVLARTSSRGVPVLGCAVHVAAVVAVVVCYSVADQDPYVNLATTMFGIGTIAIVVLQALAGISVVVFFRRRNAPTSNVLVTLVAPVVASIGLVFACYMIVDQFPVLTGSSSGLINSLPWLVAATAGVGFLLPTRSAEARPAD